MSERYCWTGAGMGDYVTTYNPPIEDVESFNLKSVHIQGMSESDYDELDQAFMHGLWGGMDVCGVLIGKMKQRR